MIVISDIPGKDPWSASSRDIRVFTEMARLHGHRVFEVPSNFADCGGVERAFAYVPRIEGRELCVLNGFIPSNERYQEIFEAAAARNLQVINSLDEFRRALEFDKSYPLIEDLTARSVIVRDLDEAEAAISALGLPLFVKGSVRSLKQFGIEACVGRDRDAVLRIVRRLFELPFHARGSVILRRLLPLRFERSTPEGFPLGREYRVFLYKSVVLDYGYYWEGSDPLERMSVIEESEMLGLAVEASRRLDVPYLAMDVGQVEGGEWFVIEPGDAQFAGFSKVNVLKLLSRLEEELSGGLEVE